METIEYATNPKIEKDNWPAGEWDNEPDKIQWEDEATGYPCLVVRNRMGALCGYVGVPNGHRFHGVGYDDVSIGKVDGEYNDEDYPPAHGGLTFSNKCADGIPENEGICHVPGPGEPDDPWWLGFDCAHGGDLVPSMINFHEQYLVTLSAEELAKREEWAVLRQDTYRNVAYVKARCAELAAWLKAAA